MSVKWNMHLCTRILLLYKIKSLVSFIKLENSGFKYKKLFEKKKQKKKKKNTYTHTYTHTHKRLEIFMIIVAIT